MPPRSAGLAEIAERAGEQDLTVITVALDSRGEVAVREFIEAAQPTYPCLIDREHRVATLYGMHNVPSAVWIYEAGRIVRTAEPLRTLDTIRQMDPKTREIPEALRIERARRRDHYYPSNPRLGCPRRRQHLRAQLGRGATAAARSRGRSRAGGGALPPGRIPP